MLRRPHDHHRDLPTRLLTALPSGGTSPHHQDRHFMRRLTLRPPRTVVRCSCWSSTGYASARPSDVPAPQLPHLSSLLDLRAPQYSTRSAQIPIATGPRPTAPTRPRLPRHTSRGFLPWRFSDRRPGRRRTSAATSCTGRHPKTFTTAAVTASHHWLPLHLKKRTCMARQVLAMDAEALGRYSAAKGPASRKSPRIRN